MQDREKDRDFSNTSTYGKSVDQRKSLLLVDLTKHHHQVGSQNMRTLLGLALEPCSRVALDLPRSGNSKIPIFFDLVRLHKRVNLLMVFL